MFRCPYCEQRFKPTKRGAFPKHASRGATCSGSGGSVGFAQMAPAFTGEPVSGCAVGAGWLNSFEFTVPGEPVAKARARGSARLRWNGGVPRAVAVQPRKDAATAQYEALVVESAAAVLREVKRAARGSVRFKPGRPLRVDLVAWFPRTASRPSDVPSKVWRDRGAHFAKTSVPDVDNIAKSVLDGLNLVGLWSDDAVVADLRVRKVYAPHDGDSRVVVRITRIRWSSTGAHSEQPNHATTSLPWLF